MSCYLDRYVTTHNLACISLKSRPDDTWAPHTSWHSARPRRDYTLATDRGDVRIPRTSHGNDLAVLGSHPGRSRRARQMCACGAPRSFSKAALQNHGSSRQHVNVGATAPTRRAAAASWMPSMGASRRSALVKHGMSRKQSYTSTLLRAHGAHLREEG